MGVPNCSRTLLQPRVMMKDCLPTRLHSVSRDTEHLNTQTSSSGRGGKTGNEGGKPGMGGENREWERRVWRGKTGRARRENGVGWKEKREGTERKLR